MDRALIIKPQWLPLIFAGVKIWEMRSTSTLVRGEIGLIEAGTGLIVGEVNLVDVRPPLSQAEAAATKEYHQVDDLLLLIKCKYPWVLQGARRYETPIPYDHPKGAMIWVKL